MSTPFDLSFGALADPLSAQLAAQGLSFDGQTVVMYQKDADAIARLAINGLLPSSQVVRARKVLLKKISRHIDRGGK